MHPLPPAHTAVAIGAVEPTPLEPFQGTPDLAALIDALTGPTSLGRAVFLAPGTLRNLNTAGWFLVRADEVKP